MKRFEGMPIKGNGDTGDSMLWSGLMAAVGDNLALDGIRKCQTSDGRLWRCVDRVNNQPQNSFSRDMSLGFILYFTRTRDQDMAGKWISYIRKEGGLFPSNESTDTRHIVTPTLWWLMSYAGMKVPFYWNLTRSLYKPYQKLEMKLAPKGFQTHLQGVALLIMAISTGKRDKKAGAYLFKKEPNNAFFAWLAGDNQSAQIIKDNCKLMWMLKPGDDSQWCWERTDSEEAWRDSIGWDFEFIDMLLKLNIE